MNSDFIDIKTSVPRIKPGVKIIKSNDYMQFKSAQELWEISQKDSKQTAIEAEKLKQKSIETGLNQGAEEAKARLAKQILKSASSMTSQLSNIEKDLSDVVIAAVRKIISDFDDDKLVLEAIKKGLVPVYQSQRVAIRVNSELIPTLSTHIDSLKHEIGFLEILPDDKLGKTDCIIESDIGIVNASIDSQLQAIEKAVKSKLNGSLSKARS